MNERPISRRRLLLVILAVVIPSLALIGLGIGLILQETQLAQARRTEAFEDTFKLFADSLAKTASRHSDDAALHTRENGWSSYGSSTDSALVLVGQITDDELLLPWQLSGESERFDRQIRAGQFGRVMLRAERFEFINGSAGEAVRAYRSAAASTQDTLQQAYAQLSLARALDKSNFVEEADAVRLDLLTLPSHIVDDFGVPLALYAAQQLASERRYVDRLVEILLSHARMPLHFSPQAGYLYRAISDTLRARTDTTADPALAQSLDEIRDYTQATLSSIRLQEDFRSVYPRLVTQTGERNVTLYANDGWLLTISSDTSGALEILVVLDAEEIVREATERLHLSGSGYDVTVLSSESSPPNRWLGPSYQGVYAQLTFTGTPGEESGMKSRLSFIVLAMILVIGLTTLGFYLWWRDTRRELVTAKLRSDFVSSVSHELKTPLTSIRMFAETLRFRSPPDEIRDDYLDTIINESGRLTRLLNNVLDFSKIGEGGKVYHPQPISLQHVVSSVLQAMEYPIRAQNFQVRTELDDSEIRVNADPDALEQVLLNLLTNAMKFSDSSRDILIGLRKNTENAEIWITDWGIGIGSEDLNRIFDSYYRADKAIQTRVPGTGLGLSLVRHAVDAHNGQIDVESKPGYGSTFTIKLPLI